MTILHFSAYYDIVYCSWIDLFGIYMRMLQICSTIYIEDTGRSKMRQEFWGFRAFRTK